MYYYLISDVCYMFRTLWVHLRGDSFLCSRLCLHASVLSVWWRGGSRTPCPIHQTANTDARKTYSNVYRTVSLRMNTRGSKHLADIRNEILVYKIVHFVRLYYITGDQVTEANISNSQQRYQLPNYNIYTRLFYYI
jgi:hypothetical protein